MSEENFDEDVTEEETRKTEEKTSSRNFASRTIAFFVVIAIVFFVMGFFVNGSTITGRTSQDGLGTQTLSLTEASQKTINYINDNLVQTGQVSFVSVNDMNGIYEIVTDYNEQEIPVYLTKDGKFLIINGIMIDIDEPIEPGIPPCEQVSKKDNPELDAFVVSYCLYGLQMQRILADVVENMPDLASNIKVRYMGSVGDNEDTCIYGICAMHGAEEAAENLAQICIREEHSEKYWDYISCFIKEGDSEGCLISTGIDKTKLQECLTTPSRGVEYAKEDFALQNKYQISGSPTLILNEERASEFDFGGRTSEALKSLVCCGFTTEPGVCSQELTTEQASAHFSETYSGTSGSGQC